MSAGGASMRVIDLVSPVGTNISGFLTQSGSICPVTCSYSRDSGEHSYFFEVPAGSMNALVMVNGDRVCVDEHNKRWTLREVLYMSAPTGT